MAQILLIDDDAEFSETLSHKLQELGHRVQVHDSAEDGLRLLSTKDHGIDLVMVDNKMPRMTGLDFLQALASRGICQARVGRGIRLLVILMTSSPSDSTAIQAVKSGAFDYVVKPVSDGDILGEFGPVLEKAEQISERHETIQFSNRDDQDDDSSLIVGRSKPMIEVFKQIAEASEGDEPILILGETGTGKDLVAQAIHTNSARKNNPYVVINSAGLNDNLLESELFGHERGAFTGADKLRKGHFEHASGGTLFLDEIGDMPLNMQAKLLRVLQNGEIMRMSGNDVIKVDVRVVAATHRDLKLRVSEGKFREDLYFRLEGETIFLPPLRERKSDVEFLVKRFLKRWCGDRPPPSLHADALEILRDHPWPGNIRQLDNVVRRAVKKCRRHRRSQILPQDLVFGETEILPELGESELDKEGALDRLRRTIAWHWKNDPRGLLPVLTEDLERELLRYALSQPSMSQVKLADRLGMNRGTLRKLLKQFGFEDSNDES